MSTRKLIVGSDIDGVICPSCYLYLEWIQDTVGVPLSEAKEYLYNPTLYYKEELRELNMDGWEYWRSPTLYDNMPVYPEAAEVLTKLHEEGHEIVFVSALKGDHHKSKVNFLKRNFPFPINFIGTKEKQYARVDVLVDDRVDNLLSMPEGVGRLLYETKFTNTDYGLEDNILSCFNWYEVYTEIKVMEAKNDYRN